MTANEARAYLYAAFGAGWVVPGGYSAPAVPYHFSNEAFDSDGLNEWLTVSVRNLSGGQYTLGQTGSRIFRRRGQVVAEIRVAVDRGLQRLDELATTFLAIFEARTINQVHLHDGVYRELGPDGGNYRGTVTVGFTYDEEK